MGEPRAILAMLAAALALAGPAAVQGQPRISPQEAAQLASAAGITMRGGQAFSSCGDPAQPRFAFVDMNADARPEAIIGDVSACYGPTGARSYVLRRDPTGQWTLMGVAAGKIVLLQTRTGGWRDYTIEGQGCQRVWTYDAAQAQYFSLKPCPGETGYRPPGAPPPTPEPSAVGGTPADRAAAFKAAGVTPVRGKYLACDKSQEMEIEIRDLNADGRPDAVIRDHGTFCYGSTEQGYTIVTKDANGTWRLLFQNQGIPTFQASRGVGGWPDIENGGPGFCFPIMRWDGSDYAIVRWKAYEPGACAGRR